MGHFLRMSARLTNECSFFLNNRYQIKGSIFQIFFFNEQIPHCHLIVYLKRTCLLRIVKSHLLHWISLHFLCLAFTEMHCHQHKRREFKILEENRQVQQSKCRATILNSHQETTASRTVVNVFPSSDAARSNESRAPLPASPGGTDEQHHALKPQGCAWISERALCRIQMNYPHSSPSRPYRRPSLECNINPLF